MNNSYIRPVNSSAVFIIFIVFWPGSAARCKVGGYPVQVGQKCIHVSYERSSWEASRDFCVNVYGGQLLKFSTTEEYSAVTSALPIHLFVCAWIGLTDSNHEGEWRWVDGSRLAFLDWHSGILSPFLKYVRDCGAVCYKTIDEKRKWVLEQEICAPEWRFLCEYEALPDPSTLPTLETTYKSKEYRKEAISEALPNPTILPIRQTASPLRREYRKETFSGGQNDFPVPGSCRFHSLFMALIMWNYKK